MASARILLAVQQEQCEVRKLCQALGRLCQALAICAEPSALAIWTEPSALVVVIKPEPASILRPLKAILPGCTPEQPTSSLPIDSQQLQITTVVRPRRVPLPLLLSTINNSQQPLAFSAVSLFKALNKEPPSFRSQSSNMAAFSLLNSNGFTFDGPSGFDSKQLTFFNAGRVNDFLHIDSDTHDSAVDLVACPTSGVWEVFDNENSTPDNPVTYVPSVSHSMDWDSPGLSCLLQGPQNRLQVFAAGEKLRVTEITQNEPLKNWQPIPLQDSSGSILEAGFIQAMALQGQLPYAAIILACDNMVLWARIPTTLQETYSFREAVFLPPIAGPLSFSSVSEGGFHTIVTAWGGKQSGSPGGVFVGTIQSEDLVFHVPTNATISGTGIPQSPNFPRWDNMGVAAVTTCTDSVNGRNPPMSFVVAANFDGGMYCVISSTDGENWLSLPVPSGASSLPKGEKCCISALQNDNYVSLAIGWHTDYFVGTLENELTWQKIDTMQLNLNMGVHSIQLLRNTQVGVTNWTDATGIAICSCGGLAVVPFINQPDTDEIKFGFNRLLPNLQMQKLALNDAKFGFGLVAGSFQDGGNCYTNLFPSPVSWARFREGNGRTVEFLSSGRLLDHDNAVDSSPNKAGFQERELNRLSQFRKWIQSEGLIPLEGSPGTGLVLPEGLQVTGTNGFVKQLWPIERVRSPSWTDGKGRLLVAVAGSGAQLFGLMLAKQGTALTWVLLGKIFETAPGPLLLPLDILSVASVDGNTIFVGTSGGDILAMATASLPSDPTQTIWAAQSIWHIGRPPVDLHDPHAKFTSITKVSFTSNGTPLIIASGSRILTLQESAWVDIPSPAKLFPLPDGSIEEYTGLDTLWTPLNSDILSGALAVVCTQTRVFFTEDGSTWTDNSAGLPKAPSITDIKLFLEPGGLFSIYVSTYGWSLWRLRGGSLLKGFTKQPFTVSRGGGTDNWGVTVDIDSGDQAPKGPIPLAEATVDFLNPVAEIGFDLTTHVTGGLLSENRTVTSDLTVRYEINGLDRTVGAYWNIFQNDSYTGHQPVEDGTVILNVGDSVYEAKAVEDSRITSGFDFTIGLR
jgi:hypothetical protein